MHFTILTPTFNSQKTIIKTIQSIKKQTFKNFNCIFIDSNSIDKTIRIIKKNIYKKKIISEKDNGIYDALNKGIKNSKDSKDSIISVLHSNDIFYSKNTLSIVAEGFKYNNVNVVFGDLIYTNKNGKTLRYWKSFKKKPSKILTAADFKKILHYGWMPAHPAVFIKKSFINKLDKYNLKYDISADYDYLVKLFKKKNLRALYIDKKLVSMEWGGKSNRIKNIFRKMSQDLNIIKINKIGGIKTLIYKNISKIHQFFN